MDPETVTVCFIVGMFGGAVFMAVVGRWLLKKALEAAVARGLNW